MGWMDGNTYKATLQDCGAECRSRDGCGFFAYAEEKTTGTNCAVYRRSEECPDDDNFPEYKAYALDAFALDGRGDCTSMGGIDCITSLRSWAGAGNCVALVAT